MKRVILCIITMGLASQMAVLGEGQEKMMDDYRTFRFDFDNDSFFQNDNGFTAGWGFSYHSRAMESWDETSRISQWAGLITPGLKSNAGDGSRVKFSVGLNQQIQTPADLSDTNIQRDDVPYAGTLGAYHSWYKLNNQRLRALQTYIGVVGPASLAEDVQKFIHNDLGMGDPPMGWNHQLSNELLLNLNYQANEKIKTWGSLEPGEFGSDISAGGGVGLGNYFTGGYAQLDWRFGWGMPQGFSVYTGGNGNTIGMNPIIGAHKNWNLHFSITPRVSAYGYFVYYDGTMFVDSVHPGVDYDRFPVDVAYGVHLARNRFAFHFTANVQLNPIVDTPNNTRYDWGTLTFDYLF